MSRGTSRGSCHRFFREVSARDDDKEHLPGLEPYDRWCVWHNSNRIANLPERSFFPWAHLPLLPTMVKFVSGWFCLSVTLVPLLAPSSSAPSHRREAFCSANAPLCDSHPQRSAVRSCTGGGRCSLPSGCLPRLRKAPLWLAKNKRKE